MNGENNVQHFLDLIKKSRRGKFKIYIGMIAGVGKSYRMLQEAHAYYQQAMSGPYLVTSGLTKMDTVRIEHARAKVYNLDSLFNSSTLLQKQKVLASALNRAESTGSDWNFKSFNITQTESNLRRHMTAWHVPQATQLSLIT